MRTTALLLILAAAPAPALAGQKASATATATPTPGPSAPADVVLPNPPPAPAIGAEPPNPSLPGEAKPAPSTDDKDFLYKATLAPDAFLTYIQLIPSERAKYKFYARHMNETQRLEYLRRVRADDREQYARDLGLPQMLDNVPEPTRSEVVSGRVNLGMTPKQVELALGAPAGKISGAGKLFGKSYRSWEKWTWQRKDGPFAVWFGDGAVVGFDKDTAPPDDDSLPPENRSVSPK
ncbi:MAG TPA: hypothetical protein VMV18_08050 [bacterium]|nr:hypothetical protein [bacterium]